MLQLLPFFATELGTAGFIYLFILIKATAGICWGADQGTSWQMVRLPKKRKKKKSLKNNKMSHCCPHVANPGAAFSG